VNVFPGIDKSIEQPAPFFVGAGYRNNQAIPTEIFEYLKAGQTNSSKRITR